MEFISCHIIPLVVYSLEGRLTCTHTHMYTHIHTHTLTHTYTQTNTHIHTQTGILLIHAESI